MAELQNLKVGVEWIDVEVTSEPYVVMTMRGYAPVVEVRAASETRRMFIGSKTLSQALDPAVKKQGGRFTGLKFRVRKESGDQMAPYIVEMSG